MEIFQNVYETSLRLLFSVNIIYTVLGGFLGTLIGALPGLGAPAGIALFLPLMFGFNSITGMVFLINIYQGVMYGGRISSILAGIPGDAVAIVTCFEGHPMALKGRAGPAIGLSGLSCFIGSLVGLTGLMLIAVPVSDFAIRFGPPEYFALMVFALSCIGILSAESPAKGITMAALGLLCGAVGHDSLSGQIRATYGIVELIEGISLIPLALGAFALSELFLLLERGLKVHLIESKLTLSNLYPSIREVIQVKWAILRGSLLGFFVGVLPGAGAVPATFMSYALEKKISKRSHEFGTGVIEGLAAPEAANNSTEGGALIPLMTLGVPGSGAAAVLMGALMIWGIQPGPQIFEQNAELMWYIIAALLLGNIALFILNVGFIPIFVALLKFIQPVFLSAITVLCLTGVYAYSFSFFDAWVMLVFGVIGYLARKLEYPTAPLIIGLVLGDRTESSLRQSLMMSHSDFAIFFGSWISTTLLLGAFVVVSYPLFRYAFTVVMKKFKKRTGSR